ncbi:MAG: preprotein translocase subunit SecD, partial [Frankiaceae bacterium]|nr:preprotein translocase subunit SecD [Frankiaceae bacterium]
RVRAGAAAACAALAVAVALIAVPHLNDKARTPIAGGVTTLLTPDRPLSATQLQAAAAIIQRRLQAVGVAGTAGVRGGQVAIKSAAASRTTISSIAARGELQFRQVLAAKAPAAGTGSLPQGAASLADAERLYADRRCGPVADGLDQSTSAANYLVTCDSQFEYLLGPPEVDNGDVARVGASSDQLGSWLVQLTFNHAGAGTWLTLTAHAALQPDMPTCQPPSGCNAVAMVVDGTVVSAPRITDPHGIRGGHAQIVGNFTEGRARALAASVSAVPLPAGFTIAN